MPGRTLDWELSTLGHPCADLAYQCMAMRLPASEQQQMAPVGLAGLDLQPLGLPSEEEYIASYCKYMGIDHIDNWNFFLAFSFFRLAAIAQGVAKPLDSLVTTVLFERIASCFPDKM